MILLLQRDLILWFHLFSARLSSIRTRWLEIFGTLGLYRVELIDQCLRCLIRKIPTKPSIFFTYCHVSICAWLLRTIKWPCAAFWLDGKSNKYRVLSLCRGYRQCIPSPIDRVIKMNSFLNVKWLFHYLGTIL